MFNRNTIVDEFEYLDETLKAILINCQVEEAKFKIEGGLKPGQVIVQAAQDVGASMIVMGTRGLGTVRRTILGYYF